MDVGLRDMLCCQRLDLASSSVEDFWQHTVVGIFGDISRGEMLVLSTQRTLLLANRADIPFIPGDIWETRPLMMITLTMRMTKTVAM